MSHLLIFRQFFGLSSETMDRVRTLSARRPLRLAPSEGPPDTSAGREQDLSAGKNVAYSCVGGVCGAAAVFPIDFAKTHLQADAAGRFTSPLHVLKETVRTSGALGMYRGLGANLIGIMPEKTIKLVANDIFRMAFGVDQPGGASVPLEAAAGGLAGGLQIIVTTPMEITKIQLQTGKAVAGQSQLVALRELVGTLGVRGLYQGTFATGMRDVPFSMVYFGLYGNLRRRLADPATNKISTLSALGSSLLAGSIGSALTTPMDVVKTRAQAAAADPNEGYFALLSRVAREEGAAALWKGVGPRVLIISPLFGIALMVKETLSRLLP